MPLFHESLRGWSSIPDTFVSLFSNFPNAFWLDRSNHPDSGFSIIGTGVPADFDQTATPYLEDLPVDFRPHLVGILHYSNSALAGDFLKVDRAVVYEHASKRVHFVADCLSRTEFEAWYHACLLRLALIGGDAASHELNNPAATTAMLTPDDSRANYLNKISAAQEYIAKGDVYQLCLTTRLTGEFTGDPLSFFLRLRRSHPAPYAGFIRVGAKTYVSISPERLITVRDKKVLSSPIKGTRPRGADQAADLEMLNELSQDEKERAENLMIVDLIRNDLSVVCEPSSIQVESLLAVKSYSTVHQLVSDISGELRPNKTGFDALAALFPGGSMTGAPKLRAMELVAELESSTRAGYSGGMGWIAKDGSMDLGMVIRTAIFEGNQVSIGIGGGITSDSVPANEHEEIKLKAKALVEGLSGSVAW